MQPVVYAIIKRGNLKLGVPHPMDRTPSKHFEPCAKAEQNCQFAGGRRTSGNRYGFDRHTMPSWDRAVTEPGPGHGSCSAQ
jgi:hypothetical protein